MKTVSFLLAGIVLFFAACKKDDDKEPATPKQQLLAKVRFANKPGVSTDIDYLGDKIDEIRDLNSPGILTTYDNFAFDSRGRVVRFATRAPNTQGTGFTVFRYEIFYVGDALDAVVVKNNFDTDPIRQYFFESEAGGVFVTGVIPSQSSTVKAAFYDNAGNITRLLVKIPPSTKFDTTDFSNYDNHPNTIGQFNQLKGINDFLLPSKNNFGTSSLRRGTIPPKVQQFSYEYNAQGNPVKIMTANDTLLLEYKDL